MKHSIDRIIEACQASIAKADAVEAKRHQKSQAEAAATAKAIVEKRKTASRKFAAIAERLSDGSHLDKVEAEFLTNLHGYNDKVIKLRHLTADLDEVPKINPHPGASWVYELLKVMTNLKQDNAGETTVSTLFLKDLGFGTTVISWVARI